MRGNLQVLANQVDLLRLFGLDPEIPWQQDAACATTDPDKFFPDTGGSTAAAKRICAACPVRTQCLTWALEHNEPHGIWGGLCERDRERLRRGAA